MLALYKFNIFSRKYLNFVTDQNTNYYKIRVYLLTCANLTAVSNYNEDFKTYIGGYRGLSRANPYPVVCLGPKHKQQTDSKNNRYYNDREYAKE